MQDPSPAFPEQEHLKCPRCYSDNTKFCYYNNYNLSQPRHFCRNCRRYWTKGGSLRNIPVGGATRKTTDKRSSSSTTTNNPKRQTPNQNILDPSPPPPREPTLSTFPQQVVLNSDSGMDPIRMYLLPDVDHQDRKMMDIGGSSFSALLASSGQFGNLLEGLNSNGSALENSGFGSWSGPSFGSGSGIGREQ